MRAAGSKPATFFVVIKEARMRIDYLLKICQLLVLEAEPARRRELQRLVDQATAHGVDPESFEDPSGLSG